VKRGASVGNNQNIDMSTAIEIHTDHEYTPKDLFTKIKNCEGQDMKDEDDFATDEVTLQRTAPSKRLFTKKVISQMKPYIDKDILKVYEKHQPFQYTKRDLNELNIDESKLIIKNLCCIKDGIYYFGQWSIKNSKPEGRGMCLYQNKALYEGFWK